MIFWGLHCTSIIGRTKTFKAINGSESGEPLELGKIWESAMNNNILEGHRPILQMRGDTEHGTLASPRMRSGAKEEVGGYLVGPKFCTEVILFLLSQR